LAQPISVIYLFATHTLILVYEHAPHAPSFRLGIKKATFFCESETYCEDIACPDCTTLHLVDCALDATCRARQHIFGFPQLGRPQVKSKGPFSREADPQSRAPGLQVEQRRDHGMRLLRGWTSRSPPPLRENWQVNPRSSALLQTLKPRDPGLRPVDDLVGRERCETAAQKP